MHILVGRRSCLVAEDLNQPHGSSDRVRVSSRLPTYRTPRTRYHRCERCMREIFATNATEVCTETGSRSPCSAYLVLNMGMIDLVTLCYAQFNETICMFRLEVISVWQELCGEGRTSLLTGAGHRRWCKRCFCSWHGGSLSRLEVYFGDVRPLWRCLQLHSQCTSPWIAFVADISRSFWSMVVDSAPCMSSILPFRADYAH